MKKALLASALLMAGLPGFGWDIVATNSMETVYTWHVENWDDGGIVITGITPKPVGEFEIPFSFNTEDQTFPVKAIGTAAFANSIGLTSVTIPQAVTTLGDYAFSNCTSLAKIEIPYGVRTIGKRPFVNTIIRGLELPDSVIKLDGNIAAGALFDLGNALADSSHFLVTEDGAVYNRDQTRLYACPTRAEGTLVLPDSLTEIGADAFFGCFRLSYLNIPEGVDVIGTGAFNVAGIWPGLDAPESAAKLKNVFFEGLPPDDKNVPEDIFVGAPADLVNYAFQGDWPAIWKGRPMNVLDDANLPVLSTKDGYGITWHYRIVNGFAEIYNEDKDGNPIAAISPKQTTGRTYKDADNRSETHALQIPISINGFAVTRIGDHAFDGCQGLTIVGIPETVSEIGDCAFRGCSGLNAIDSWENIPWDVTTGCINLPYGIERIGYHAFEGVKLQTLVLPDTADEFDGNPVAGCAKLATIGISDTNPQLVVSDGILFNKAKTKLLGMPACADATNVEIPDTVTTVGKESFFGCSGLKDIRIPASVEAIESGAFAKCEGLTRVTFDGPEPSDVPEDVFDGSEKVIVYANKAYGWSGDGWKGRKLVVTSGGVVPSMTDDSGATWSYVLDGDTARVTGVSGATGDVIIPATLGGRPVTALDADCFNSCSGITSFVVIDDAMPFSSRNGALYSADGKTLVRVPDTYQLEATVRTETQNLSLTVTVVPAVNPDGTDGTTYTTNSVVKKTKTSTRKIPSTVPTATLLAGVTEIRDYAFAGCGVVENVGTTITTNGTGVSQTGFICDGVYAKTTYDATAVTVTYDEIVCVPENISFGPKAFAESGVTEVLVTPLSSIRLTATLSTAGKSVSVAGGSDLPMRVGLPFSLSLESLLPDGSSDATISVSGLSGTGLRLVKSKAANGRDTYSLEGTPTKPIDEKTITVTAKKGKSLITKLTFELSADALPTETVGTFSGFLVRSSDNANVGTLSLTTTDAGKITAKVTTTAGTTSFSATHWDAVSEDGLCSARLTTRKGEALNIVVNTKTAWNEIQVTGTFDSAALSAKVAAQKNLLDKYWYFACSGNETDGWILHPAKDSKSADLKVTLSDSGKTSLSGKVGSYRISVSGFANVSFVRDGILAADFMAFVKVGKVKRALCLSTDLRFDHKDSPEGVGSVKFTPEN